MLYLFSVIDDATATASDDEMVRCLTTLVIHPGVRARMRQHNQSVPPTQDWPTVVGLALTAVGAVLIAIVMALGG